jgi:hypothetical protein
MSLRTFAFEGRSKVEQERVMLRRIAILLTAATALGFAAPASAQVYGGGWWGGPYGYYHHYPHRYYNYYYPRHHFFLRHHFYGYRSWWGGY